MADSAIPGCGYYADNHGGAIALSGDGEAIARLIVSARVIRAMETMGPEPALEQSLSRVPHLGGDGGGIAISPEGEIGWWHNSPHFAVGAATESDPEGRVRLHKEEK
jgi:beta-aspartyl-peptidase (threonine type)